MLLDIEKMRRRGPIGVFDSGLGGLTILKELKRYLPHYDYVYLGDSARAPYGTKSFDTVYKYTLECVNQLFKLGCPLIILACNTASAKALRKIQQQNLSKICPSLRVLGIIRPTAEIIGGFTKTKNIGILATKGTVDSESYLIEIGKFFPQVKVHQEPCKIWVPLIENNELDNPGTEYFIKRSIDNLNILSNNIDTVLLGCTHYSIIEKQIRTYLPSNVTLISQGEIVAKSLIDYLRRHPEIDNTCSKNGNTTFFTTDIADDFNNSASLFYNEQIKSTQISIGSSDKIESVGS